MPFNKANLIVEHGLKGFGTTAHEDKFAPINLKSGQFYF